MFHTSESKKAAAFYLTLFSTLGTICKPAIEIPLSLLQQLKFVEMIFLSTVAMKLFQRSIWNELVWGKSIWNIENLSEIYLTVYNYAAWPFTADAEIRFLLL